MMRARTLALAIAVIAAGACDDATGPLVPTEFAAVTAGARHTCALNVGGVAYCWGAGEAGELGDGQFTPSAAPVAVDAGVSYVALSAGFSHTCGISVVDELLCWGWNFYGQLGNATTIGQGLPIPVALAGAAQQVTAGWFHTCALTEAARAFCWGSNGQGQLGDGSTAQRLSPVPVAGNLRFARLAAGGFHTCGVTTAGAVYCWGLNHQGQLGTGDVVSSTVPRAVAGAPVAFTDITTGYAHTCALDGAGAAYCWGSNDNGELAVAFASEPGSVGSATPAAVKGEEGASYSAIDAGLHFTCAVRADGPGRCWGLGVDGQLGTGAYTSWITVQPVADVGDFLTIEAGGTHACGYTRSSAVLCWGDGRIGQLGVPASPGSPRPVRIPGVTP